VYGVYSLEKKVLSLSGAGHHALPVIKRKTGETETVNICGFPVGWFDNAEKYEEKHVQLFSGDKVSFYTDGVFEVFEEEEHSLSSAELTSPVIELLNQGDAIGKLRERMKENEKRNKRQNDDVTFLIMRIS